MGAAHAAAAAKAVATTQAAATQRPLREFAEEAVNAAHKTSVDLCKGVRTTASSVADVFVDGWNEGGARGRDVVIIAITGWAAILCGVAAGIRGVASKATAESYSEQLKDMEADIDATNAALAASLKNMEADVASSASRQDKAAARLAARLEGRLGDRKSKTDEEEVGATSMIGTPGIPVVNPDSEKRAGVVEASPEEEVLDVEAEAIASKKEGGVPSARAIKAKTWKEMNQTVDRAADAVEESVKAAATAASVQGYTGYDAAAAAALTNATSSFDSDEEVVRAQSAPEEEEARAQQPSKEAVLPPVAEVKEQAKATIPVAEVKEQAKATIPVAVEEEKRQAKTTLLPEELGKVLDFPEELGKVLDPHNSSFERVIAAGWITLGRGVNALGVVLALTAMRAYQMFINGFTPKKQNLLKAPPPAEEKAPPAEDAYLEAAMTPTDSGKRIVQIGGQAVVVAVPRGLRTYDEALLPSPPGVDDATLRFRTAEHEQCKANAMEVQSIRDEVRARLASSASPSPELQVQFETLDALVDATQDLALATSVDSWDASEVARAQVRVEELSLRLRAQSRYAALKQGQP